jgi:hypothetical protein
MSALKSILESHTLANLRKEVSKTNVKNYSGLTKPLLIAKMMATPDRFKHIKSYVKTVKPRAKPQKMPVINLPDISERVKKTKDVKPKIQKDRKPRKEDNPKLSRSEKEDFNVGLKDFMDELEKGLKMYKLFDFLYEKDKRIIENSTHKNATPLSKEDMDKLISGTNRGLGERQYKEMMKLLDGKNNYIDKLDYHLEANVIREFPEDAKTYDELVVPSLRAKVKKDTKTIVKKAMEVYNKMKQEKWKNLYINGWSRKIFLKK